MNLKFYNFFIKILQILLDLVYFIFFFATINGNFWSSYVF